MFSKHDFQYSLRLLRKTPVHTGITLLVLVMGLSLFVISYTFAKMLTDKPMPFPDGDRYVTIKKHNPLTSGTSWFGQFDLYSFERLRDSSDSYSVLAAILFGNVALGDGDYNRQVGAATLSQEILEATSVKPILGRLFAAEDSAFGSSNVALISYDLWQDYYAGNPNIIGTTSRINNQPHDIIGVMPEGFNFPLQEKLWLPLRVVNGLQPGEGERVSLAGILRAGVSEQNAETEANVLMKQLTAEFPDNYGEEAVVVSPYASAISPSNPDLGFLILSIGNIVLALCIINLSALLLMRATARKQELAVRATLGAGSLNLIKHVLLESFFICMAGLGLSLLTSFLLLGFFSSSLGELGPFWQNYELNMQTFFISGLVAVGIWVGSGVFVAFKASVIHPGSMLDDTNKGAGSDGGGMTSKVIVTLEVILSCFLLVSTGAFIATLQQISITDYGLETENTVIASFELSHLDVDEQQKKYGFIDNLIREIREIPEITDVAVTTAVPGDSGERGRYTIGDDINLISDDEDLPGQRMIWVSSNYFSTMGVDLVRGRHFDSNDSSAAEDVVIITEEFAQQLWPQESPLGKRISARNDGDGRFLTVIGTLPPVEQSPINIEGWPNLYRPIRQGTPDTLFLSMKHIPQVTMAKLELAIRVAGASADRNVAIDEFQSLDNFIEGNSSDSILYITEAIALGTILLATIGIYAVIGRSVSQRTQEIGIRRALGSSNFKVFLKFGKQGFYFLLAGIIFGSSPAVIVLSSLSASFDSISSLLLPVIWTMVTLIMFAIVAAACYIPTRIALRLDPADALRHE